MKTRVKLSFSLIFTLAAMLTMAQTAWAGTTIETRTATWQMDGGASGSTTLENSLTLLNAEGKRLYYYNTIQDGDNSFSLSTWFGSNTTSVRGNILNNQGELRFTNLEGTVTKVELKNFSLVTSGIQMYVGRDKTNTSTLLHLQGNNSDYDVPSNDDQTCNRSATFEGSIEVSQSNPLKIMFADDGHNASQQSEFGFAKGYITVTYEVEVEAPDPEDPGHTFSFNASGNTLTATCNQTSQYHNCSLGNSRTSTLTLTADDVPYTEQFYVASLNLGDFIDETGLAVTNGGIVYRNKSTGVERTNGEYEVGDYTVTATIIISGTSYTLTKDFDIYNGTIACDYPQFSFIPIPAIADNDVTITFTPIAGEGVETLTLTGDKTNMSIGNGITDNHDGTYTFTMVKESLTLDATFSAPDASHFEQNGDTYTIKTANGWGWFCFATNYDLAPDGFSGKVVKLAGNVSSSEMAGKSGHPFKGTFDGQNHTLTFNRTAAEHLSAPFHYINGATISNLHVQGTITGGTYESLGGLVGHSEGNITIKNCRVSTEISTTVSGSALHGGVIGDWNGTNATCTVTGCVYDGLIYNPNGAGVTTSCRGFIGWDYGNYGTITFTDCLFAPAAYGTGKYTLGGNCFTFVYPNSDPTYNMTNCYYTSILGNRQGRPAATATVAPANLGNETTDHGMVDGYKNGFLYDGNYYTPKYGDAVVEYRFNEWNERADVTINGTGNNLVGVNITEEVGNIKSVTYNRPFNTAQAATVILPFNYICNENEGSEGGKFYGFKEVVYDEDLHKWVCTMVEPGNTAVTSLTANTPYVFMPNDATTMMFPNISSMTGGVVTLLPTTANDGLYGGATTDAAWNFHGTYKGKSWAVASNDYGFAAQSGTEAGGAATVEAGQFVRFTIGAFIKPMRCYLSYVGTEAPAPARGLTRSAAATDDLPQSITVRLVSRSGETTAIGEIDTKTGKMTFDSEAWYTLDGVRLSGKPSTKGIYINNGRKIVIK